MLMFHIAMQLIPVRPNLRSAMPPLKPISQQSSLLVVRFRCPRCILLNMKWNKSPVLTLSHLLERIRVMLNPRTGLLRLKHAQRHLIQAVVTVMHLVHPDRQRGSNGGLCQRSSRAPVKGSKKPLLPNACPPRHPVPVLPVTNLTFNLSVQR
eukprot:RCo052145